MSTVKPNSPGETSAGVAEAPAGEVEAALAYERIFVPALFEQWPEHVIAAAGVGPGDRTLDIACGTGVLTRRLPALVGERPVPVGLDISAGMLEVARRINAAVDWRRGDASRLPFDDASFDRVLCQFGLMFFPDGVGALREMKRVLAPGGRMAVAVWDTLDNNPGFREKVDILDRVAGTRAGDALRAPFCLGDLDGLREMTALAGLRDVDIRTVRSTGQFPGMHAFVEAEVRGWLPVMDVHLSEDVIADVHGECARHLAHFAEPSSGRLRLPASAHIISGC